MGDWVLFFLPEEMVMMQDPLIPLIEYACVCFSLGPREKNCGYIHAVRRQHTLYLWWQVTLCTYYSSLSALGPSLTMALVREFLSIACLISWPLKRYWNSWLWWKSNQTKLYMHTHKENLTGSVVYLKNPKERSFLLVCVESRRQKTMSLVSLFSLLASAFFSVGSILRQERWSLVVASLFFPSTQEKMLILFCSVMNLRKDSS